MNIPGEAIKELKIIHKKKFSLDLCEQDALNMAENLLTLFKNIYKPIKKEDYEK